MPSVSGLLIGLLLASRGSLDLALTVGKSVVVDSASNVQRVSVANGDIAEAVAVTPREILVNGKSAGETTLILWRQGGPRQVYDVMVKPGELRVAAAKAEIRKDLPGQAIGFSVENDAVFLRGEASNMDSAERAVAIASTVGKVVNLLNVRVPPPEPQVLLKVRFANVDRAASQDLGANLISTGALNTPGTISTGQFSPARVDVQGRATQLTLADALNIFLMRPDLDLGATIRALQSRRLLEILAEPNVLAINGKSASFVAGGEFPFPTLQGGGGGLGAVTIQFREFGVRIQFLPRLTARGTIRLEVTPEVSALDVANGLVFQGFSIPALSTRRVHTEIELASGQSFAIAGLLDNRTIETMNKIPGIGDIPLLGKLFQSRSSARNSSELLVIVTPELVRPIPESGPVPEIRFPEPFLKGAAGEAPRTPGIDRTGPAPAAPPARTVPYEELLRSERQHEKTQGAGEAPQVQFVPVPLATPRGSGG